MAQSRAVDVMLRIPSVKNTAFNLLARCHQIRVDTMGGQSKGGLLHGGQSRDVVEDVLADL